MSVAQAQKPFWAELFKIEEAQWQEISTQAEKQGTTPLALAFERGLYNESKWLTQERDRTGLASINELYFNAPAPTELMKNFDAHWCRKNSCLPLTQWDGHVYWAKLSGDDITLPQNNEIAIWVLAPWSGMKKWFQAWQPAQAKPMTPPTTVSQFDLPGGIHLLDEDEIKKENEVEQPAIEAELDMPAGLNLNLAPTVAPAIAPPTIATPVAEPPITKTLNLQEKVLSQTASNVPMPMTENSVVPLSDWQNHFDKTMILTCDGKNATVLHWSPTWPTSLKPFSIALDSPSIFKIVASTSSPYHGYVSPNPVNDSFFKQALQGQYPEHISILPVIVQKNVVGMILGVCTKDKGKKLNIFKLSEQAEKFSQNWAQLQAQASKAG